MTPHMNVAYDLKQTYSMSFIIAWWTSTNIKPRFSHIVWTEMLNVLKNTWLSDLFQNLSAKVFDLTVKKI